jgi:uncharacterized membrane protein
VSARQTPAARVAEGRIGRTLIAITYVAVVLLSIGVVLMVVNGISPLSGGPGLDLATLGSQLATLQPAGFLWLGLLIVVVAPSTRVVMAAVAYARDADWLMVAISIGILAIIATGVVTGIAATL